MGGFFSALPLYLPLCGKAPHPTLCGKAPILPFKGLFLLCIADAEGRLEVGAGINIHYNRLLIFAHNVHTLRIHVAAEHRVAVLLVEHLLNDLILSAVGSLILPYPLADGWDNQRESIGRMLLISRDSGARVGHGYRVRHAGFFVGAHIDLVLARGTAAHHVEAANRTNLTHNQILSSRQQTAGTRDKRTGFNPAAIKQTIIFYRPSYTHLACR